MTTPAREESPGDGSHPETGAPETALARAHARARFLALLAETGIVRTAAATAGVSRATIYRLRENDPEFAAAWHLAIETAADALEEEAHRRAVTGWEEPVFHKGKPCGAIRRYSDRMLELLLKSHRPKFRESAKVEVSGPNGGPIQQDVRWEVSPEYTAEVCRILDAIGVTIVAPRVLSTDAPPALPADVTTPEPS